MRLWTVLAAATAAFVAGSPSAGAAGEGRLDVFPDKPRAGERATIQLRTYWTYPDRVAPGIFGADYPMTLNALGPSGRQLELRLVRDAADPHVWRRSVRFPASGHWIVCGANFQGSVQGCAEANLTRRAVRVRPRSASVDVWHRLQRPLTIPSISGGGACPTAAPSPDLAKLGFAGTSWGRGPAYPAGLGEDAPLLQYDDPIPRSSEFFGSVWPGNKILWIVDRSTYRGPILIRGRQVDGPNLLRFDRGRLPPRELRIGAATQSRPSFTRVRAPGCYAYQVDGLGFSNTIVFTARPH